MPGKDSNSSADAVLRLTTREFFAGSDGCATVFSSSLFFSATDERCSIRVARSFFNAVGAHGNDRQNEGRDEENESRSKNPKGERSQNQTYPTSFDGGRLRMNWLTKWKRA